ncbi:hypothetical protein [Dactylosporangium darangshiense]|uniref:hypothetical protein n=1 Tax=Dactylosporangium darangshiense TaxID=579108 RepID=UPI0031EFE2E4
MHRQIDERPEDLSRTYNTRLGDAADDRDLIDPAGDLGDLDDISGVWCVKFHSVLTASLGKGSITHVINNTGLAAQAGNVPSNVISCP